MIKYFRKKGFSKIFNIVDFTELQILKNIFFEELIIFIHLVTFFLFWIIIIDYLM